MSKNLPALRAEPPHAGVPALVVDLGLGDAILATLSQRTTRTRLSDYRWSQSCRGHLNRVREGTWLIEREPGSPVHYGNGRVEKRLLPHHGSGRTCSARTQNQLATNRSGSIQCSDEIADDEA